VIGCPPTHRARRHPSTDPDKVCPVGAGLRPLDSRHLVGFGNGYAGKPGARSSDQEGNAIMGTEDKARNKAEKLRGKAKEQAGRVTNDRELEAQGRTDQTKSDVKQAGEKVKDAFRR
jgi:uncharacterized protein YjbJ (UPF0337 family)